MLGKVNNFQGRSVSGIFFLNIEVSKFRGPCCPPPVLSGLRPFRPQHVKDIKNKLSENYFKHILTTEITVSGYNAYLILKLAEYKYFFLKKLEAYFLSVEKLLLNTPVLKTIYGNFPYVNNLN